MLIPRNFWVLIKSRPFKFPNFIQIALNITNDQIEPYAIGVNFFVDIDLFHIIPLN